MKMGIAWALGRIPKKESKEPDRMSSIEADIDAHIEWLKKKEAVYFDHMWSCNTDEIDLPINGYLYIPEQKAISYKLKIDEIISSDNPLIIKERIHSEYVLRGENNAIKENGHCPICILPVNHIDKVLLGYKYRKYPSCLLQSVIPKK